MINFYTHIHQTLTALPDHPLVVWPQEGGLLSLSFTGKDILQKVSDFRVNLKKVRPGQKVLLLLPVDIDMVGALLAVQSMGAVAVLPPAKPSLKSVWNIVFSQGVKAILVKKGLPRIWSLLVALSGRQLISTARPASGPVDWSPVLVHPDQPALITHTSGSTGQPKAVYRSHRVLTAQHEALREVFPPWPRQRDYPLFPNIILHNLACGTTSILPLIPGFRLEDMQPAVIAAQMQQQGIETMTGNVYYFRRLVEYLEKHPQTFPALRAIGIGGSPVPETLLEDLKKHFSSAQCYVIYGSSEAEPIAVRRAGDHAPDPLEGYAVGEVYKGLDLRIDPIGTISLPGGEHYPTGEIAVKGAHVAATTEKSWHPTGDYGYFGKDGQLYLTGRKGNERIHAGLQHYQLEHWLLHQKGVRGAAALAGEQGFTIFVQGEVEQLTLKELLDNQFPAGIINDMRIVAQLPLDGRHHSKVLYEKLTTYEI